MRTPAHMGSFAIFVIAIIIAPAVQTFDLLPPRSQSSRAATIRQCMKTMMMSLTNIEPLTSPHQPLAPSSAHKRAASICINLLNTLRGEREGQLTVKPSSSSETNAEDPTALQYGDNADAVEIGLAEAASGSHADSVTTRFPYTALDEVPENLAQTAQETFNIEDTVDSYPGALEQWPESADQDSDPMFKSYLTNKKERLLQNLWTLQELNPSRPAAADNYPAIQPPIIAESDLFSPIKSKRRGQFPFGVKFPIHFSKRPSLSINNALQVLSDMFHADRLDRIQKNQENLKTHMFVQG